MQMKTGNVIIIGAGLSGTLLAIRLAQRGFDVQLFEKRPDLRRVEISAGRSINLALSHRGLNALQMIGIQEEVKEYIIPMYGRMIHAQDEPEVMVRYSGRPGEHINSVSRSGLNASLLNKADKYPNIDIQFSMKCIDADPEIGRVRMKNYDTGVEKDYDAEMIFGADGAGSAIRKDMMLDSASLRFNFSQSFLDTGYKELSIPPDKNGNFQMEANALHIWPRDGYMMIALPNPDKSFTVTVFLRFEGNDSFASLDSKHRIKEFFKSNFSDAYKLLEDLFVEFKDNPVGALGTIKCFPWHVNHRSLLLGDAAHAIVPFYGQGMNCAFEDCVVLDKLLDKHSDWKSLIDAYQHERKKDTDAIADLAEDNFYEMRDLTDDPIFNLKRKVELKLEESIPGYYSKYGMVTFRPDMDYHLAMKRGRAQDRWLMELCRQYPDIDGWPELKIWKLLQSEFDYYQ